MKKIMIIAAAVAAMAACTKSTVVYEDSTEIGISPVNYSTTKAVLGPIGGNDYPYDETFGVFAYHTSQDAGTAIGEATTLDMYLENVEFAKKGEKTWGGKEHAYYWPKTGSLYFVGYSPYGYGSKSFDTSTKTLTISDFTQGDYEYTDGTATPEGYNMVDLMWFDITKASANTGAPGVTFTHALSYLTFELSASSNDYDNLFTVTDVYLENVNNQGTFTAQLNGNRTWTGLSGASALNLYSDRTGTAIVNGTGFTIDDVLVIPQEAANLVIKYKQKAYAGSTHEIKQEFKVKLTGGDQNASHSNWYYARHYYYKITFSANEILLTPSIENWVSVSNADAPIEY